MRILLLITSLGMGGAERQVVDLADAFVALGHEVLLVCLTGEPVVKPTNVAIRVITLGASRQPWRLPRLWSSLGRVVRDFRPDVLHSHLVHANLLARMLRLTTPVPLLISSAHNSNEEGWWRMLGYRLTDGLSDVSTNVSDEAVRAFERSRAVGVGSMLTVYNGISTQRFKPDLRAREQIRAQLGVDDGVELIVAVGRLCPPKDYPNLIRAVATLRGRHPNICVAVAGEGPLLEELQALALHEGLDPTRFIFLGLRLDVENLMSAADVFALSSAWEGFGLVVAEAMACGRTVVATDCGGVREVLGDAGFLVPPKDPARLAAAIDEALGLSLPERDQIGGRARRRVEQLYSIGAAASRWLEIYRGYSGRREGTKCAV